MEILSQQVREHPRRALMLCAILYMISLVILVPGFLFLLQTIFGLTEQEMQQVLAGAPMIHPSGMTVFRMAQTGHQLLTWGWVAGMMFWLAKDASLLKEPLKSPNWKHVGWASLLLLVGVPLLQVFYLRPEWVDLPASLAEWEQWMEASEDQVQKALTVVLGQVSVGSLLINLFVFALVPAVCEEIFFRGVLLRYISRSASITTAVILSSALFSFVHFQFYGFLVRFLLGVILAVFVIRAGNLLPAIMAHFCFNALTVVMTWLHANTDGITFNILNSNGLVSWPVFFVSLGLSLLIGWIYMRLPLSQSPST